MVTSSAVVGSSAMIRSGPVEQRDRDRHALAHAAGELVRIGRKPLVRAGMPTLASASRARARAAARGTCACARIVSTICVSMRSTGLSVIIGSWKIIAMRLPRSRRISLRGQRGQIAAVRSAMRPPTMRPGGSTRPMIE